MNIPHPGSAATPAVYWRRRVIALTASICLLGLLAWTVNGTLSRGAHGQAASGGRAGGGHRHPGPGGGQHGGGPGSGAAATPRPTASHPSPAAATRPGGGPAATPRPTASRTSPAALAGSGSPASHSLPTCARSSLVLSLFTDRYWYQAQQWPEFTVDVVSTSHRPCAFDLGTRSVSVLISNGQSRVWESADCVQGPGSRMITLTRGVPAALHVSWDRQTSSPGCHARRQAVHLGPYVATAFSGHVRSRTLVIVLGGSGVAVP